MKAKIIFVLLGSAAGALSIHQIHKFILADACLDTGGQFSEASRICIDGETYEQYFYVLQWPIAGLYLLAGIAVASITFFALSRVFRAVTGRHDAT